MTRTAVVTGSAGGFGHAVVTDLLDNGWDVVALVRPGGSVLPAELVVRCVGVVAVDLRHDPSPQLGALIGDRPVDLLVNAAAGGTPVRDLSVEPDEVLAVLDVNTVGPLRVVRTLAPNLLAAPDPLVLNVSSRLGSIADQAAGRYRRLRTSYAYRVSKAALNMLTVCLAAELDGVRVWSVHPGTLTTSMGRPDATTPPAEAAARLRSLAASSDRRSPRFVTLDAPDGTDLPW